MTYVGRPEVPGAFAATPTTTPAPVSPALVPTTVAWPVHLRGTPCAIAVAEVAIIPALGPFFNDPGRKIPAVRVPTTSSGQDSPLGPDQVKEYPLVVAHDFDPPFPFR